MAYMSKKPLQINSDLETRLSLLASRSGVSVSALAEDILRNHADEQERLIAEYAEDDKRWQRYESTGETVSASDIQSKLRRLAKEATLKAETE